MSSCQLIKLDAIHKSFGVKQIFNHLSLVINRGQRIALIGENGCGKTTLARLILGIETPDKGTISRSQDMSIGYLDQNTDSSSLSVQQYLLEAQGSLLSLKKQLELLEESLAHEVDSIKITKLTEEWDNLHNRFMDRGGYASEEKVSQCIQLMNISHIPKEQLFSQLSGGEQRRVQMAALLIKNPDLLVLDEPTNHLDVETIEKIEDYLNQYGGALLIISHDRQFLNKIANCIFELTPEELFIYQGNYDDYKLEKTKRLSEALQIFEKQKTEISDLKRQLKMQIHNARGPKTAKDRNIMAYDHRGERNMTSRARVRNRLKTKLEEKEEEKLEHPIPKYYTGIVFHPKPLNSYLGFSMEYVQINKGDRVLLSGLSHDVRPGSRIILSGPNGCGKTTLIKHLVHRLRPAKGKIAYSPEAVIGYLPQDELLGHDEETLLYYLGSKYPMPEYELRSRLCRMHLIDQNFILQRVDQLSLGQKRKLQLLDLMFSEANFMLLDEPTNHLAPDLIDDLEDALIEFSGVVVIATHDRRFAEKVGTHEWKF